MTAHWATAKKRAGEELQIPDRLANKPTRNFMPKQTNSNTTEDFMPPDNNGATEINRVAEITSPDSQLSEPYDPFDLKTIRINQATLSGSATKLISSYSVRKPRKNAFFRVHPGEDYQVESFIYVDKDEGGMEKETYFVDSIFALQIEDADLAILFQKVVLHLAIERHAEKPFVWPLKHPISGGKDNDYWRSAREHAETAKTEWIRISASEGSYDVYKSRVQPPDPVWTTVPFSEILRIAFKGRLINSKDHSVMSAFWGVE